MLSKVSLIPFALVALGGAGAASASDEGQWVTTFLAGSNLMQTGSFNPHATGTVADLGTIDPSLAGMSGESRIDSLQLRDAARRSASRPATWRSRTSSRSRV